MFQLAIPKFPAANVQQAAAFYEQKLGFRKLFDYGDYAGVARDGVEIHLWECANKLIAENTACRIQVADVEAVYAEYQQAGVIHPHCLLEVKPWGLKEFVALDLDGNALFIFQSIAEG